MIVDGAALPENRGVSCDVCIVGSGPAGLTLARELSGRDLRVCVLESGSFEIANPPTRSLSELESEGNFVQVTPDSRNRRFGGNASFWGVHLPHTVSGVRLIPFLPSDFERREGVPYSGWPFSREYLEPYYARAQKFMGAGPYHYGLSYWEGPESPALPLGRNLQTAMFMFGNGQRLTEDYRRELERSTTTTVYCSSNAVELETDESGDWVRRVRVATVSGQRFWVDAKFVLLAAGGVENAHLLLVSNKVHQKGLGNANDLVGRFFMDHPIAHGGYIFLKDRSVFERTGLYDKRARADDGVSAMGGILLSDAVVREQGLLNLTSWLFPRPMWSARADSMDALRRFARGKSLLKGPSGAWSDLKSALAGGRAVLDGAYNKLTRVPQPVWPNLADGGWHAQQARKHRAFGVFEVLHLLEQAPDPENRIMLGESLDVLGRRKAYLRSSWREIDQRGVDYGQKLLDQGLRAAGIGYFEAERRNGELIWSSHGASHHIGTARMAQSPRDGVVDEHGKVHGMNNLYVAGSATFPTGSSLNPTLTIVALAARMADRVRALLEREHHVTSSSAPPPSHASASGAALDVGVAEAVSETSSN